MNPTDLPAFRLSLIHRRIVFLQPLIFLLTKAIVGPFAKRTVTWLLGLLLVSTASPLGQAEGQKRKHWAFQPIANPPIPTVPDRAWPSSPLDHFILRTLSEAGMGPSPKALPRTLIRRAYFDLIGLPPTSAEVAAFENEYAANPLQTMMKLVDQLLASQEYGERWGRHWLDVARYADAKGYVDAGESKYPFAYTYRDYVVRAFNEDLPYDQFVREQIAADLLGTKDTHSLAALGFLTALMFPFLAATTLATHTPQPARLRLLLVGGVSFPFSF